MQPHDNTPYGYCHCGCGEKTTVPKWSDASHGYTKGVPVRFIRGHQSHRPVEERFWEKVIKSDGEDGCWEWTACKDKGGYGRMNKSGLGTRFAHRISYILTYGSIPDGLHIDHLCRNRACVRPDHLEPVTLAENNRRGQPARGESSPRAILTEEQVREIRRLRSEGVMYQTLVQMFGVSDSNIWAIVKGLSWKHLL